MDSEVINLSTVQMKNLLHHYGLSDRYFKLSETGATVEEAAETIHVSPDAIAKSLVLTVNQQPIVVVLSGTARLGNHQFKEEFEVRPRLLAPDKVKEVTGFPVGGVNPIGLDNALPVYLDNSLRDIPWLYPAAGDPFHALKLSLDELIELSRPVRWVKVSRVG